MRKIELQLIEAIKAKSNFNKDNTFTTYCPVTNTTAVFLHGNHIGTYMHLYDGFRPDINTLKRWPTNTTKSRLRALGVSLTQKKGVLYIDGVAI